MLNINLVHGLRYVLVYVSLKSVFPPVENSPSDIALLRAANCSMQRKMHGIEDAFLFVVVGRHVEEAFSGAISAYGFPNATVLCVEADEVERRLEVGEEYILSEVGNAVEVWLNNYHIGAVATFAQDYAETGFWWGGVEHCKEVFDWPFGDGDFAKELPGLYRSKAATWLTILGYVVDLNEIQANGHDSLTREIAAAWAATLCEWLHGFEAASGNSYNYFGYDVNSNIYPSQFFLGFELARLSASDLETACEEADVDLDGLCSVALKAITRGQQDKLRKGLSDFFSGDRALYWALHSTIWPNFTKPMAEALELELDSDDYDDLARLDLPWRYVSEGWSDEADND